MSAGDRFFSRLVTLTGSRYAAMLLVILVQLSLYPFIEQRGAVRWMLDISGLVLVAAALRAVSGKRGVYFVVLALGAGSALAGVVAGSLSVGAAFPYGTGFRAVFLGYVVVVIFSDIFARQRITMDAVLGACCVYLLMGLSWQAVFQSIEWLHPGSFALPGTGSSVDNELLYFSLITMTTIGYGDITPTTPPARMAAAIEGLAAQLYLAIIIARMVSMELAHRRDAAPPER